MTRPTTVAPDEIAKFAALADSWWDPAGAFQPLHKFNPARLAYLRDQLARHFGRSPDEPQPFTGLTILDIGCGGGLLAEPLTRLGFAVTGIDAGADAIGTAKVHAERMGLSIDYEAVTPEELATRGPRFDAVLAMEVVEHVDDIDIFMNAAARLLAPGDRKSTRLNSSHIPLSRMPSSA